MKKHMGKHQTQLIKTRAPCIAPRVVLSSLNMGPPFSGSKMVKLNDNLIK